MFPRAHAIATVVVGSLLVGVPVAAQSEEESGTDVTPTDDASAHSTQDGGDIDSTQASGSNAGNYRTGATVRVNPRTGAVELSVPLFRIPGRSEGLDATFSLSYSTADAIGGNAGVLGLPDGWSTNLSYREVDQNGADRVSIDGSQSYFADPTWLSKIDETTNFTTGLLQYNRGDANYKTDDGTVEVNDKISTNVLTTLDGRRRYLDENGLLIQEVNRFGDSLEYTYHDPDSPPSSNELASITDSWRNTVTFDPGTSSGFYKITLPDGRVVSYQVSFQSKVTRVTDAESKTTIIQWGIRSCEGASQVEVPTQLITASGGMTTIEYQCMSVCTEDAHEGTCPTTTWPVAMTVTVCPSNPAGEDCSTQTDKTALVTEYGFGGTHLLPNGNNYTGYPVYSPFDPEQGSPPGSDILIVKGGQDGEFKYTSIAITKSGGGEVRRTVSQYNYLHLLRNRWHCVQGSSPVNEANCSGNAVSKHEAHCYTQPDSQGVCSEPLFNASLPLPANYQAAKVSGSCVYPVNDAGANTARVSTVTREYNLFGHVTRATKYHGTSGAGVVSASLCTEQRMFNPSSLQVVSDNSTEYDLPVTPADGGMFELGALHYGQMTKHIDFQYLDEGTLAGPAARSMLASPSTPIRVTLVCDELAQLGATVPENSLPVQSTSGLISNAPGSSSDCSRPTWVWQEPGVFGAVSVAPPKVSTFTYDQHGRRTGTTHTWAPVSAPAQPGSAQMTTDAVAFARTTTNAGEDTCTGPGAGSSNSVESVAHRDSEGNTTIVRHCTLNGFVLSSLDADGDTTLYSYDRVGLATRITEPNGDVKTTQYCYRCPPDTDGTGTTCGSETPCQGCPKCPSGAGSACGQTTLPTDTSCVIHTQLAGPGNQSFADKVQHATIKDGIGRTTATYDNLGASGGAYHTWQQRSSHAYNSIGLPILQIATIGVTPSASLSHPTQISYNATFQPVRHCNAHGVAHDIVHDNVGLMQKASLNGNQHTQISFNDSMHQTAVNDCPLGQDTPTLNSGCPSEGEQQTQIPPPTCCPAVSSATGAAICKGSTGDIYPTRNTVDGAGTQHVVSTGFDDSDPLASGANPAPPIKSVTGTVVRDAHLQKYGYAVQSVATSNADLAVSSNAAWGRDLNARPVSQTLTVSNAAKPTTSDTYDYDEIGRQTVEFSKLLGLANPPQKSHYTPTGQLSFLTDYAGNTFYSYYDNMKRMVRYCYPAEFFPSGSEGRKYTHDSITGQVTSVTHFRNPSSCPMPSDCKDGECSEGDLDGDAISYTYSRFGGLLSKTYSQVASESFECPSEITNGRCVVQLSWGYDAYQRPVCFADAVAHAAGSSCLTTPIPEGFSPDPSTQLAWRIYWGQGDPYRRGLLKSACRGVIKTAGDTPMYETQCTDYDYYTSVDTGGGEACPTPTSYPQGALAGLVKMKQVCVGGSCLEGTSKPIYIETMAYDLHRRPCYVDSRGCSGDESTEACLTQQSNKVLSTAFTYDQYNNVLSEVHESEMDMSSASNYQMSYTYDGLMRLTTALRSDLASNVLKKYAYTYDAMSNITERVVTTYGGSTGGAGGTNAGGTGGGGFADSDGGGCNCRVSGDSNGLPLHVIVLWAVLALRIRRHRSS